MNLSKRISKILLFFLIGLAFGSGIASAEYLGPDRTYDVTTWETCEKGVWAHKASYVGECYKPDGVTPATDCIDCTWECDRGTACGSATYWYTTGTVEIRHTTTYTDPEATVASTTNCAAWGDASWCVELSSVTITASEPVSPEYIMMIEGTQNSSPFACAADTCTVNMLEGSNVLTYWALSTYGDSSRMGNLTVLQDTIAPEINASVSGTLGTNNWFVSNATLSVVFSDASPGSGLLSTSALINGTLTDVSAPVTLPEGVYTIQLDTRDVAGWTASTSQTIYVDTTAPAVTANQPAVEVSNGDVTGGGYMNGSVVFTGTYSDATSGVSQIQVSPDGSNWFTTTLNADGTWIYDWDSSQATDGSYTPLAYAVDNAGNRTDIALQPITLDNSAPAMSMTGAWYIWDSGHIVVYDTRVGIKRIELSVRDDQNRWPAREWDFDTSKLEMDLQWDREFGDGTVAPTGSYEVLLQAWDQLGNGRWITSRIYIPEAGATAVIPLGDVVSGGTFEDTPTPMAEQTEDSGIVPVVPSDPEATDPTPTDEPEATSTPHAIIFSSEPVVPASGESKSTSLPVDPNLLTGAAALAAAASATAYSLQRKEEKEAERKRQEAQSKAEAMAIVRAAEATKVINYLNKLAKEDYLRKVETARWTGKAAAEIEQMQIAQEQYADLMELIASTGGRAVTDLSEEQLEDFKAQGTGAQMALQHYYNEQIIAYNAALKELEQKSENLYREFVNQEHNNEEILELMARRNYDILKSLLPSSVTISSFEDCDIDELLSYVPPEGYTPKTTLLEKIGQSKEYQWVSDKYMLIWKNAITAWKLGDNTQLPWWQRGLLKNFTVGVVTIHIALAIGAGILLSEAKLLDVADGLETAKLLFETPFKLSRQEVTWIEAWAEIQLEFMDLNIPGNTLANDIVENADDFDDAVDIVNHNKEVLIEFITSYGDEGVEFFEKYGDEGVEFVLRQADRLDELGLTVTHGKPVMELLDVVDLSQAEHLLDNLDDVDIGLLLQFDDDIIRQFSKLDAATINNYSGKLDIISEYGEDAIAQINQHGIEVMPFIMDYGDKGVNFLKTNDDEAVAFIINNWIDAPEKVALAVDYGKPAMQLLDSVDATGARKLLDNLTQTDIDSVLKLENSTIEILSKMEPDGLAHLSKNLDKVVKLGPNADHLLNSVDPESFAGFVAKLDDVELANVSNLREGAIVALSKWEGDDLVNYGSELIARAEKDAVIFDKLNDLAAIKKNTGKIDFKDDTVKQLIDDIANNSVQGDSGRFALGKWAGRDGGYIGLGRSNGYAFYESPGDFWNAVDTAVGNQKDDLFWAINQNVLEKQIQNNVIFEYTLDGIVDTNNEIKIVEAILGGKSEKYVLDTFRLDSFLSRYKELELLKKAGYSYYFDDVTFIISK